MVRFFNMRHKWNTKQDKNNRVTYCVRCGLKRELLVAPYKRGDTTIYTTPDNKFISYRAGRCTKDCYDYLMKILITKKA